MLYFTSLWLFCTYQSVLLNPFTFFTQTPGHPPRWQPSVCSLYLSLVLSLLFLLFPDSLSFSQFYFVIRLHANPFLRIWEIQLKMVSFGGLNENVFPKKRKAFVTWTLLCPFPGSCSQLGQDWSLRVSDGRLVDGCPNLPRSQEQCLTPSYLDCVLSTAAICLYTYIIQSSIPINLRMNHQIK